MDNYTESICSISDPQLQQAIVNRLDDLTKPPGSLGRLEQFVVQYCLCRGSSEAAIGSKRMVVFAADHGIAAEGVSPYPQEVTRQMVVNMLEGKAAISVLCAHADIDYMVVDSGVAGDLPQAPNLINVKACRGTRNFLHEPAMSVIECQSAVKQGYTIAHDHVADIFGIGEMGIGNTSSAAALYALLFDLDASETVGAGTGVKEEQLDHKKKIIRQALEYHRLYWDKTPADALRRVGGFEIAGMCGFILGSAAQRIPVVIDGFIATAAAITAIAMAPAAKEYLFFGHLSDENFHRNALQLSGVQPILDLGLRLGEGSGAVLAMQIIEQALHCYHEMATFSSAGVTNRSA